MSVRMTLGVLVAFVGFFVGVEPVSADTIELRSGEVLIGEVTAVSDRVVTVRVSYPESATKEIEKSDLAPRSLYSIVASRIDGKSAGERMRLAQLCLEIGLPGHAIAEYREASRLDPTLGKSIDKRISVIRSEIATRLLADVTEARDAGKWERVHLNARHLVDRYPKTTAARQARKLLRQATSELEKRVRAEAVDDAKARRAIGEATRKFKRAQEIMTSEAIGHTVKEQRRRERSIRRLESAWKVVQGITTVSESETAAGFASLKTKIREQLHQQYVALGTLHVKRRSLPAAESWNVKACELDPKGGGCANLQNLIVQARITNGNVSRNR